MYHVLVAIFIIYSVASLITFIVYARDKLAARKNQRRVPEKTLHVLALAGGWPGAFIAQATLRHKSAKTKFLIIFWLTAALNCAALIGVLTLLDRTFM